MEKSLEILVTELSLKDERIAELEYCLEQLKSQLSDIYRDDSVIITVINNALKN